MKKLIVGILYLVFSTVSFASEVWLDKKTNFYWQDNKESKEKQYRLAWGEVSAYCKALSLEGKSWAVPTVKELADMYKGYRDSVHSKNPDKLKNLVDIGYWSSQENENKSRFAWRVSIYGHPDGYGTKTLKHAVRCVSK